MVVGAEATKAARAMGNGCAVRAGHVGGAVCGLGNASKRSAEDYSLAECEEARRMQEVLVVGLRGASRQRRRNSVEEVRTAKVGTVAKRNPRRFTGYGAKVEATPARRMWLVEESRIADDATKLTHSGRSASVACTACGVDGAGQGGGDDIAHLGCRRSRAVHQAWNSGQATHGVGYTRRRREAEWAWAALDDAFLERSEKGIRERGNKRNNKDCGKRKGRNKEPTKITLIGLAGVQIFQAREGKFYSSKKEMSALWKAWVGSARSTVMVGEEGGDVAVLIAAAAAPHSRK
ncbi:hypothetical protein C8J57DRAFT_1241298 [Mycena rebaudengoi]|nr:hypothetical protein C8J57DRAFT_1241298 [Mycena rebaudengoi]